MTLRPTATRRRTRPDSHFDSNSEGAVRGLKRDRHGATATSHSQSKQPSAGPTTWIRRCSLPKNFTAAELKREKLMRKVNTRSETQVAAQASLDQTDSADHKVAFKRIVALVREALPQMGKRKAHAERSNAEVRGRAKQVDAIIAKVTS
jgi:hypothetical protein